MKIRVQCYASHRGEEEPRAFYVNDRRHEVMEISDRWLSPGQRCFKVQTYDGSVYILHHDVTAGEWEMTSFSQRRELLPTGVQQASPAGTASRCPLKLAPNLSLT